MSITSTHRDEITKHLIPCRVQRVLRAYSDDKPFSVDLVNAIVRQCSFVDKMHEFGWSSPGFFDLPEDELVLQHAIARYHGYVHISDDSIGCGSWSALLRRFLDLISQSPKTMLVPTLDIDLVWHTHQLMGSWYHADCGEYLGRYIDQWVVLLSIFYMQAMTLLVI